MVALVGAERAEEARAKALALYKFAASRAEPQGIILADTKFEFGMLPDGDMILIDEVLTPDSSRFWDASTYEPGRAQDSFDKQFVRDWLETLDWGKTYPGPGAARRGRRRHTGALRGGLRAHHRRLVRVVPGRGRAGGARMSDFRFAVDVMPRDGILDPQGRAVETVPAAARGARRA